jgi:multidrug efflux system membrane fusion protein
VIPRSFAVAGTTVLLFASGCNRETQGATSAPAEGGRGGSAAPVAVSTAPVVTKPMTVKLRSVGNVEASSTVEVRSQVSGELLSVNFTEGQDVRQGQLLFTIDPRAFEAALKQAEAGLERDTAQAKNLEAQHVRLGNLLKQGLVSQADYDAAAASAAAMQASIAAGKAAVENARLLRQYTRITAPVGGRTGALLVHPGSLIRANDTAPLVVINRLNPAFVSFSVPARLLPRLRKGDTERALGVEASPAGAADSTSSGTVTFVDNAVDPSTDTIRLKATFPNSDRRLWPGAFVDVTLQLSVDPRAIVLPSKAVQPSQQGEFVFVVRADQTVEARQVKVAWTDGDESVIEAGVKAGETVVTDGQLRLTPGARVTIKADEKRP